MALFDSEKARNDYLYHLFLQDLKNNLLDDAMNFLEPLVEQRIATIVAGLEVKLQEQFDVMGNQTVIHLVVNGVKTDGNGR